MPHQMTLECMRRTADEKVRYCRCGGTYTNNTQHTHCQNRGHQRYGIRNKSIPIIHPNR